MNDESLIWALTDWKAGRINLSETLDKIDAVYVRAIGGVPVAEVKKLLDEKEKI